MDKTERGKLTSGNNISYWLDSVPAITFEPLNENKTTDVVIVGGGIAGVTTAYCLARSGKKIILVEDGNIGSGETGRTTAHLVSALDDRYYDLEKMYGEKGAKTIAHSHQSAVDFIEQTSLKENIQCDFLRLPGYLFLHPSDERDSLSREYHAAKRAGIDVEEIEFVPGLKEKIPALKFAGQAQFHPLKYQKGLTESIIRMGGQIYTGTHAETIDHTGIVTKDGHKVEAKHVVVTTNSPVNNKYAIHLKQYPYRTYVIVATVKKGSVPTALWWDTGDFSKNKEIAPYHYVRTQPFDDTYDLLICGGEDHQTGIGDAEKINEQDRYALLEYWVKQFFKIEEIVYNWSGQVLEPMDSIAYIGRNPSDKDNVYIATGDSGNGMTHGTIAGMLLSDLINGNKNEWEKIYDPSRFKIFTAGKTFFKELGGGTLAYLKNKSHESKPVEVGTILANEGKIIEVEGEKFAAHRDENGELHIIAAECAHLGCIIKWNTDEKTWDCPCHGSRYTHEGKVLNGPANKDLEYFSKNK
jgi:glycine/D-amino acid oxidase-like deaminating enzyme/nitrite reductase/ring-hydroxylating ferredoxin subunit